MGELELKLSDEFKNIDFNSKRLNERFQQTLMTFGKRLGGTIYASSESRAEAKAIYRMLGNARLDSEKIAQVHKAETIQRIAGYGDVILAVQDTTGINYATHKKTKGLGYNCEQSLGINLHSCMAVTPEGIMLGVLDQYTYTRPEPKDESKSQTGKKYIPIEEKESFRWLETMRKSNEGIPPEIRVINVCDREGDMYELFERAQETDRRFLIRIVHNRRTTEDTHLIDAIQAEAPQGTVVVAVPRDSRQNLKPREALLTIRYREFEIKKPDILRANQELSKQVSMNVIYVREEVPEGAGYEPIEWFLATNEPVTSIEEAYEKVGYYLQRWKIERFHYVLKSGCKVEKLQERTLQKTEVLLLMYSIIAVCILNMTYLARVNPDLPCSILLEEDEWQLLYRTANKSHETPQEPYSLKDAITYLSRLGGPKRAPSDGPPGVKTIWMGLITLNTLLAYREYLS